jgi:hypothetical protein
MEWVLLIGAVWLLAAALVGLLIGKGIRLADRKQAEKAAAEAVEPNFVVDAGPPNEAARPPEATPSSGRTSRPRDPHLN